LVREFVAVDAGAAQQALHAKTPAVLRGLVRDWPAVRAGLESADTLVAYLKRFDSGAPVDALMTPPEIDGQIHYSADMSGFNFHRNRLTLAQVAEQVLRYARFAKSPAVAAQSALIRDCLPGFTRENALPLLREEVLPRIWLGNRITTPAHVDEWNNIGCVVAGRRRFTLFPPEQLDNLYIGPLDFAPTGAPMSLVSLKAPDFARFPKFRMALEAAQSAELDPGDGLYIPPLWWHHVESLQPFNVLVNYWWHDTQGDGAGADSAFDVLVHGILSIRSLPPETRAAWRAFFEHYVFGEERDLTHIPQARHGLLGALSDAQRAVLRAHLAKRLGR
jgi:hypothetical protein